MSKNEIENILNELRARVDDLERCVGQVNPYQPEYSRLDARLDRTNWGSIRRSLQKEES